MKNYLLLIFLLFPVLLGAQPEAMRYKFVAVNDSQWQDPKKEDEVRKEIDRMVKYGFNAISIGTYKFMPAFFVDYTQTKYPEAVEFDSKRIKQNVSTLRSNIQYAKSKGIALVVSRSYSLYAPYRFWKAHQKELNPGNMYDSFLQKAHQNNIYTKTISSEKKGDVIPHQQWNNTTFREFFLYSTGKLLDAVPELDGFLNAYAEAAWTLDKDKIIANDWKSWKDCIDYDKTDDNFVDYCNSLYDLLKEKRSDRLFFGMRDWYVKPEVLKRLKMPKQDLVISVKYAGYDQPLVNYPLWGKDLQDAGYSVIMDMLVFDSEHPHPLYWYNNDIVNKIFENIYQAGFAGVAYQDFQIKGDDSPYNPIRLLTQETVGKAINEKAYTDKEALTFLRPYYSKGSEDLLKSLKAVSLAQENFIKLMPAWFWQGDGLTPGGLQAYRFWMLIDHPEAPEGMAFVRQDAVGIKEYTDAVIAGKEKLAVAQEEWKKAGKKTPDQMMERMSSEADQAIEAVLKARTAAPAKAPYMLDMTASAYIHRQLVLRQTAFLKAAICFYESGYVFDDKFNKDTSKKETGIDKREECVSQLQKMIYHDKMLAELCRKYAPRRPERRGMKDYVFEKKVVGCMKMKLEVPEINPAELAEIVAAIEGK